MELLLIILIFMACVIAVAIRKDVKDMSKREHAQSIRMASQPEPVLETNKNKQQAIDERSIKK